MLQTLLGQKKYEEAMSGEHRLYGSIKEGFNRERKKRINRSSTLESCFNSLNCNKECKGDEY